MKGTRTLLAYALGLLAWSYFPLEAQVKDANLAMNDPDRFAWQLFVALNRPAEPDSRRVIWEQWIEQNEVYKNPCTRPVWPDQPIPGHLRASGLMRLINAQSHGTSTFDAQDSEQVRINRVAFDYIVANDLWYQEGVLAHAIDPGIDFPQDSIIVKTNWTSIGERDKPRYQWQVLEGSGLVGLNGFHVISKDLPFWFWSTFEHVDNPGRCDTIGCKDTFGSDPPYFAPHRFPDRQYPPGQLKPKLLAMFEKAGLQPQWKHYRLKGTMVSFTDATGRPHLLGNSVLEPNFEASSSCMTCHARASVSQNTAGLSDSLGVSKSLTPFIGDVGTPDPSWFFQTQSAPPLRSAPIVYPVDFLWELAQSPQSNADCAKGKN